MNKQTHRHKNQNGSQQRGRGGRGDTKAVNYMVMGGEETLDGECAVKVYRCCILKTYTQNVYNVIKNVTPTNLVKVSKQRGRVLILRDWEPGI